MRELCYIKRAWTGSGGRIRVKKPIPFELLFEIKDVFGKRIRTSKDYWQKIKTKKHKELKYGIEEVKITLRGPDRVSQSVRDPDIALYFKKFKNDTLVVIVKCLNQEGFLLTVYQTKKPKKKGKQLWLR